MVIAGTMYIIDEPHIEVLYQSLATNPPPTGQSPVSNSLLCLDMDESDDVLEKYYPNHVQKATVLCPPPSALCKEIDGDSEGFIKLYNEYLDFDESVQDFVASILFFLHMGGNVILYTPAYLEDDTIWTNVLLMFFYTRFGITTGSSITQPYTYNPAYDVANAKFMYAKGVMGVLEYINLTLEPVPDPQLAEKLYYDLLPYCGPKQFPGDFYTSLIEMIQKSHTMVFRPMFIWEP